ncbi:MAG: alpha/beta fold hydrolase [Gemmatimonadaceae bacterium]
MWRWTKRIVVGIAMALISRAFAGATYQWTTTRKELSATPAPGRLIDVGGHRLHLWCVGDGEPTVILETGLGGSSLDWGSVQPNVASCTRVCSYDRAGMGYRDPGPSPRTARRIARELAQLLDRSGINGPVVLVAASIGGFGARVLASEQSDCVAALVLVDASHEKQDHRVPQLAPFVPLLASVGALRMAGIAFGPPPDALAPSVRRYAEATRFRSTAQRTTANEISHVRESAAQVAATRRTLTLPVIVLTAGRGADAAWLDLQRDLVELSQRGCHLIAEQSGHVMARENPDMVVIAIRTAVQATREQDDSTAQCPRR